MDLTHSFTVPTSVDDAWTMFMDLEKVGNCFPGATVTEVTDDGFAGTVKVKLGPIALVYSGTGSFVERDDATHRAVLTAKGKDKRGNGTAGATVTIALAPDGDGTRADVVTDLAVTGKPAQFGRGVMQDVSDKLLQAFITCIEQQAGAAGPPTETLASQVDSPDSSDSGTEEPSRSDGGVGQAARSAAGAAAAASPAAYPATSVRQVAPGDGDALDLGSTVGPVLVQRYAAYAAVALVGVAVGWAIGRARSGR